jgi:hypothetical protein
MLETLLRVEFLLANRENEFGPAIAAGQRAVLQCHNMLSVPPSGNSKGARDHGGWPRTRKNDSIGMHQKAT